MSEFSGPTGPTRRAARVVHESYSFVCLRCGHGWEQAFVIEHHTDAAGKEFVRYVADGRIVPSPLSRPTCRRCGNHIVRIMRPGRVASARAAAGRDRAPATGPVTVPRPRGAEEPAGDPAAVVAGGGLRRSHRGGHGGHWHLFDLLHVFHLHRRAG